MVSDSRPFRLTEDSGVHFHPVSTTDYPLFKYPPQSLSLANKLAEVAVEHDLDLIHAHYAVPHAITAILASQVVQPHPVRVVTTLHGTDITLVGSHRDFYRVCRYAMLEAHGLTAVSNWLADQTVKAFDLPTPPQVIPNFVDCDRFSAAGRAPYPGADGPFELMHASNFRPVKRVFDVVRVFGELLKRIPARLTMVGDGPERGMAAELASELGIAEHVRFVEPIQKIEDLYRKSHLFLLLSDYESFGLSALEALACGTPVIASRSGGLTEVIDERTTGRLCAVGDVGAIADAAYELLTDEATWRSMSAAASLRAKSRFCREMIVAEYENFYQHTLSGAADR